MAAHVQLPGRAREAQGISEVTLAHLYRAEVQRSTVWRTRLDTTTNWAITSAAALISFTFTSVAIPHATLLVGAALIFTFLYVEARRYRYYDLWARRVRLMESGYLVPLMRREPVTVDFFSAFATELVRPRLHISTLDALSFRLRRTYAPIFVLLLGSWVVKLDLHPVPAQSFRDLIERANIGPVHGIVLWVAWAAAVIGFIALMIYGHRAPMPPTELRDPGGRPSALSEAFRLVGPRGRIRLRKESPIVRPARDEDRYA